MKKAWRWVCDHVSTILVFLVAVLGAGMLWDYQRRKLLSLKEQLAVQKAKSEIAALQARKTALLERADEKTAEIEEIDRKLVENRRMIVAQHEDVATMSDREIEDAFARLGY